METAENDNNAQRKGGRFRGSVVQTQCHSPVHNFTDYRGWKSVKSPLFNLLVLFVQWEGVGSIEGAERKSGRSGEEENQNTKFSAWVVFSKWNLKSSETQWSPLFPPSLLCVCEHTWEVGWWWVTFSRVPSSGRVWHLRPLSLNCTFATAAESGRRLWPMRMLVFLFFPPPPHSADQLEGGVKSKTEIMSDFSSHPTCLQRSVSLSSHLFVGPSPQRQSTRLLSTAVN